MSQTIEAPNKKKNVTGLVLATIAFGLTYFAVQHFFFRPASLDKMMVQMASELNESLPMMVDQDTRLDNVAALPNIFQYNYTLVNTAKSEIILDTLKKYLEPFVLNNVKTNPDLKVFRDNRTTLTYSYRDKNGEFVHKFAVSPDQYEEARTVDTH